MKQPSSKNRASLIACFLFAVVSLVLLFNEGAYKTKGKIIASDVYCYYNYLPAVFKYHRLDFEKLPTRIGYMRNAEGTVCQKMTMGLAFLYLPFYLIALLYISLSGIPNDEYSAPYSLLLSIGTIFYMLAGMLILRKILLKYFKDWVVFAGLCFLFFGTNVLYYTVYEPGMSHVYNFFLISTYLWLVIAWHKRPSWKTSVLLGFVAGLIILIRPSNAGILLIALLWQTHSKELLKTKWLVLKHHLPKIILAAACAALIWMPQMAYWKYATGHFLYESYVGEHFFFLNPHLIYGLFSYRNGWLMYAPVMIAALAGIFLLRKQLKPWLWPVVIYFVISFYVICSWWCWWYVGFGLRPMIDLYPVLSLPLCAAIAWMLQLRLWLRIPLFAILLALGSVGLFKTYQFQKNIIHFDSMTGKAYWRSFWCAEFPEGDYYGLMRNPDYNRARQGDE
jgi:hypothetical protein